MKTFKKYISLLLVVLMITTTLPFTAYADTRQDAEGSDLNVTWSYTADDDTLYINGSAIVLEDNGAYPTYIDGELQDIKFSHLIIGSDVQSITLKSGATQPNGDRPYYSDNFDVVFEEGSVLETIGSYAFYGSTATSMTLPASVTTIQSKAFCYARQLEYIDMSAAAATTLPIGCFEGCYALVEAKLPSGLTAVSKNCFSNLGSSLTTVEIPDTVTTIADNAFNSCKKLQLEALPESLTSVGDSAFYDCTAVSFNVGPKVKTISQDAFAGSGVRKVNIKVDYLNKYAFYNCRQLTEVYITADTYINSYAFTGCTSLERVAISGALTQIYSNAFENCTSLRNVDFSGTTKLNAISYYAFSQCTSLEKVVLPDTLRTIQNYAFDGCSSLEKINLNNTQITFVSEACFRNSGLKKLIIPSTVTTISKLAFVGCKNLEELVIPATVTTIGVNVFTNSVIDSLLVYNRNLTLTNCGLQSATIGEIRGFDNSTAKTFANSKNIPFVILGSDDENDDNSQFSGTIATDSFDNAIWHMTDDNELVIEGSGAIKGVNLYDENGVSIPISAAISAYGIEKITFSEGITRIPANFIYTANKSVKALHSISLPSTLTSIGANAFRGADLDSLVIPENCISIGDAAFQESGLAGGVTINAPLTMLAQYLFFGCDFESFTVPNTVQTLGSHCLNNCFNLNNVVIPPSVINFDGLRPVGYKIQISGGQTYWTKLEGITITCIFGTPAFEYATSYAFELDYTLTDNYITGYISSDKMANWFYDTDAKRLYVVPFGNSAFTSLGNDPDNRATHRVYYDDGTKVEKGDLDVDTICLSNRFVVLRSINNKTSPFDVFNPKHIEFPYTFQKVGDYAFVGLDRLEEFIAPKGLCYNISNTAFKGSNVKTVDLSKSDISCIKQETFMDCKSLETVILHRYTRYIEYRAFAHCTALKYINLDDVFSIYDYAFYQCTSLDSITISASTTKIGQRAFAGCLNVKYIDFYSDQFSQVAYNAFAGLPFCDTVNIYSDTSFIANNNKIFEDIGSMTTGVHMNLLGSTGFVNLNLVTGNVTHIHLGKDVQSVAATNLENLKKITVDEENENLFIYDDCLYERDNYYGENYLKLILAPRTKTEVNVLEGTTDIYDYAFAHSSLKNITLPEGVEYVYQYAFYDCKELRKVNFPTTFWGIDYYAFKGCTKLRIVSLPSCICIYKGAFYDCTNLASILLPDNLESIGVDAFSGCTSLKCVVIPESCEFIEGRAFVDCSALEDVYMYETDFERTTFIYTNDNLTIHTMVGSVPYQNAIEFGINVEAYTDEDIFADECAMMEDIFEGYIGFCGDEHGDIDYLTVYEPTCTQDGYIIGVCEYCSVILEEIHIPACSHDYTNTVSIPATATTQAVDKYECKNCGDVYTVYAPPTDGSTESVMCTVYGTAVIANDKAATKGTTPLANVDVMLGSERIASTNADGIFSVELETGVYELTLHYNYGFDRELYVVVTNESVNVGTIPIIACDWNKDGTIDDADYQLFRFVIASSKGDPAYLDFVDMNNDGKINVKDLAYMNNVKGLSSSTFEYPEIIVGV